MERHPIPIGATGHAARTIWNEVTANLDKFYASPAMVKKHFQVLGDPRSTNEALVEAAFAIADAANGPR